MSAVNVFGSPIDKKKYRKVASGVYSFSAPAYYDATHTIVSGLKFVPDAIMVFPTANQTYFTRASAYVDCLKYGTVGTAPSESRVIGDDNAMLIAEISTQNNVRVRIYNNGSTNPLPIEFTWVALGW